MNINELIKWLTVQKYVAMYNIFSQQALHEYFKFVYNNKGFPPIELPGVTDIDNSLINIEQFVQNLNSIPIQPVIIKRLANTFITRNWFKEIFRFTQKQSEILGLKEDMRKQDWYQFSRLVANGLSHDGKWTLLDHNNKPKAKFPINYNGNIITVDMHGTEIHLPIQVIFEINEQIISFFNSHQS